MLSEVLSSCVNIIFLILVLPSNHSRTCRTVYHICNKEIETEIGMAGTWLLPCVTSGVQLCMRKGGCLKLLG